jgi:hypothetical protein
MEKNPFMMALLEKLAEDISAANGDKGMSRSDALAQNKCCRCSGDASKFRDDLSRREYPKTVWCQNCQDDFFGA